MSYIKPPTKDEKTIYWKKFQTVSLFTLLASAFVILLFVLGYLFRFTILDGFYSFRDCRVYLC